MKVIKAKIKAKIKSALQRQSIRRRGFWFVDVPRTSSTSIKNELSDRFGTAFGKGGTGLSFIDHTPAFKMREVLGPRTWDKLYKFSIVRNPWARTVSFYRHAQGTGFFTDYTFVEFVRQIDAQFETGESVFSWHGPYEGSLYYLEDSAGNLLVDKIVRFEDRESGLREVGERIGYPEIGRVLLLNQSRGADSSCSEYYDDESRRIIEKVYAREIEQFSYEFDGI